MHLITGGFGFLGTGLARYLLDQGEEVVLTRRRNSRVPAILANDLGKGLSFVDADILDLSSLITAIKQCRVTSIVHTALTKAALYHALKTNCEGTTNVLEAARLMDIKRVTFTSSITIYYGLTGETLCKEDTPIPIDVDQPIASEKIAAEALCNMYAHEYGPPGAYRTAGHDLRP